MAYSFNLEWHELPEELRNQKIMEYLEAKELEPTEWNIKLAEVPISARFPIYF